jgi:3-hydroxyacyl-CoA dehydrogenase
MINEAFFVLAEGDASTTEIDEGMTLGCNHPMGPLALADLIGFNVLLETRPRPAPQPRLWPTASAGSR